MPLDADATPTTPYECLLLQYSPRPITSQARYRTALRQIDSLMRQVKRSRAQDDLLDVLTALVVQYEERHHPSPEVSPSDMLQHLMELRGLTKAELSRQTAIPRQTITNIVTGTRGVSRENRKKLAAFFHVSPLVFLASE
jgi:HTH-type transcriptional regulator/antitoxin HigA